MHICHPSAEPVPFPHIPALPIQRGVPPIEPLAVRAPLPPPLSISLQGIGVPPSSTFSHVRLCSSALVMVSDVCVS